MKKRNKVILIAISIVILSCIYGCSDIEKFIDNAYSPSEIDDGFSAKWLKILKNRYNLTIPESAVYQRGYYEPGIDFSVHLLFTVNKDDFKQMIGGGWKDDGENHSFGNDWYTNLTDVTLPHCYVYSEQYTVLFSSDSDENGMITCVFVGWRP